MEVEAQAMIIWKIVGGESHHDFGGMLGNLKLMIKVVWMDDWREGCAYVVAETLTVTTRV